MMRRGIWRSPSQPGLFDTPEPVHHGRNLYQQAPHLRRQDPTSSEEAPPASTPPEDPPPAATSTETVAPPPASTTPAPPASSSTSSSTTTTPASTPSATRPTTTTPPPTQPTVSNPPPAGGTVVIPSTSTSTTFVTQTGVGNTGDGGSNIDSGDKDVGKSTGFFSNKAAVGGVFGVAGVIVLVLVALFVTNAIRRSRAKKIDRELTAAAATGPAGYHDEDDEQPTYPFQQGNKESYDMHEFNGQYAHPYAAPGVVGAGAAGAAAGYYNGGHHGQGQQGYGQDYNQHQSYPGYSDSGSSYPSTGPGYYDPRYQDQYAQPSAYAGQDQYAQPSAYAGQSSSPPPRVTSPPVAHHMSPTYNGTPSPSASYAPAAGMAGMGAYGSTGAHRASEAPSAYGGAERGAYAHMQRQDQLNRALSQRSNAPTYATNPSSSHPSSSHDHAYGGLVTAAGLGGAAAAAHPLSPRADEKAPLPPMPPQPASPVHAQNPPRTSGEHDAGNKSEGELPNPFRGRISGESISGDEWDDEESAAHAPQRVLKVANQ